MNARPLASMREEEGAVFPPRTWFDIQAYDEAELIAGFLECEPDDPEPGPNRSPAFRWGWMNRKRDRQHEDDGYDHVRREYLRERPSPINLSHMNESGSVDGGRG